VVRRGSIRKRGASRCRTGGISEQLEAALREGKFDRAQLASMSKRFGSRRTQAFVRKALETTAPMNFVHDDDAFDDLLQIVAADRGLGIALVEKDYWVTHGSLGPACAGIRGLVQGRYVAGEGLRSDRALLRGSRPEARTRGPSLICAQ
jgi:hypothetical protein